MQEKESEFLVDKGNEIEVIVKYLKPGTRLVYNVYDSDGNLIHPAKKNFHEDIIYKLLESGIEYLYYTKPVINDQYQYCNNVEEYLDQNIYNGTRAILLETQKKAVSTMKTIVQMIKNRQELKLNDARSLINNILHDIQTSDERVINLLIIQNYDDLTYTHSLNVGIISIAFALKLGLKENQIKDIGLAAFLHDIGKLKLPYEIINKADPLTTEEMVIIKKHPVYGYELLQNNSELSDHVKNIVLLHHEKVDGSGYPFGYKDKQLAEDVAIVSLAEAYDMLTTDHPYKNSISSREAFNRLLKGSGKHFHSNLIHRFINEMRNILLKENHFYSIGSYVLLDTHEVGMILSKVKDMTSRPQIEILINPYGKILENPQYVDLKFDQSRNILKALDDFMINSILASDNE